MTRKPFSISNAARLCMRAAAAALTLAVALAGCGGAASRRRAGPAERGSHGAVNLRACGNPATDLGRRMHAFLQATVALEAELASTDAALRATCDVMARRLGLPGAPPRARRTSHPRTLPLCTAVAGELRAQLAAGLGPSRAAAAATAPATASPTAPPVTSPITASTTPSIMAAASSPLVVRAAPAACTVRMDIAAQAAAACSAGAGVALLCRGTCQGTCTSACQGTCDGRCEGRCQSTDRSGPSTDGTCNGLCQGACVGTCEGTCDGTCEGTCSGHVDVTAARDGERAEPACEVSAELAASAAAVCTAPAIELALGTGVDATRLGPALRTMREDLPIVLGVRARLAGPLQAAMLTWGRVATDLVAAGPGALRPLGGQASCVFAQIEAAAARLAAMQASLSEQLAAAAALEVAARLQPG